MPASIDRYRWPTVAKSWACGAMSPGPIAGAARLKAASPGASCSAMPSGRSRNMKCRSAASPNGSSVRCTPDG